MLQNMAKLSGKKVEQDKAAAVKADKGSTGVKAASAKESVDYGKVARTHMPFRSLEALASTGSGCSDESSRSRKEGFGAAGKTCC